MSLDEIQSIKESLARIETALMGDSAMGNKGLVVRMQELEAEAAANAQWRDGLRSHISAVAGGVAVVVTATIQGVVSYFTSKQS